ncbi:MAG: hypothetical protein VX278_11700 [Myxococcota bacterium]|nr:hypothetical protein [Myxococcota bacterium]
MPLLTRSTLQSHTIPGSNFTFSAASIQGLSASEYTISTITIDTSGSVHPYIDEIEKAAQNIVTACRQSPRSENIMLRTVEFNSALVETHGFKTIPTCDPANYHKIFTAQGYTALYDATINSVESLGSYGRSLYDHDFDVNGIIFVITDGGDNNSKRGASDVKASIHRLRRSECLDSLLMILIGVNVQDASLSQSLERFSKEADFDHYIELADADPNTLAKLSRFVSRSISLQSRSLGTGNAPRLTF